MFCDATRRTGISLAILLASLAALACGQSGAQAPAGGTVTALTGARVIDGTGAAPLEQATVIIRDGRIEAVGASSAIEVPDGATTVDMTGKTIMPGLVNAHGHVQSEPGARSMPVRDDLIRRLRMYADYGVTTVVSLGSNPDDEAASIALTEEQDGPELNRARLHTSGTSVRHMSSPEEARQAVDRLADIGVDIVKFHVDNGPDKMSPETLGAIIDQAHARGLRVAGHIFYLDDAKEIVERGVDIVAHSVRDQDVDEELIMGMKSQNIGYVPTLTRELSVFVYESTPEFFTDPFFLRGISLYQDQVDMLSAPEYQEQVRNDEDAQAIKQALEQASRNLKLLSDADVLIGFGTDSGAANNPGRWQGYFEHVELEMMADAGLTPMEVLTAATGDAARVAQLDDVGTIAPGRFADLLVLDANPLDDIRNTRQINSVWIGGQRLGPATMTIDDRKY